MRCKVKADQKHIALVVLQAVPVAFVFIALMSVVLYYYPAIDLGVFRMSQEFHSINALTVYSVYEFGWIHTPSLGLGLWFCFALWASPRFAGWLMGIIDRRVVAWELQRRLAQLEEERNDA